MFADFIEFVLPSGSKVCLNRTQVFHAITIADWRTAPTAPVAIDAMPQPRVFNTLEVVGQFDTNNNGGDFMNYVFDTEAQALEVFNLISNGIN